MKPFKILVCIALIAALLSGCNANSSPSRGLGDMTIVQGIGIDLDDDKTAVSLQYLNLENGARGADSIDGSITTTASGTADTIANALAASSKALSQEIFLGQNKLIVFGEDYAKSGIEKGLDFLLRSIASRPDVAVAMSLDDAKEVIESKENDARVPAENVFNLLQLGEQRGLGAVVTVDELLNLYSDKTSDIYLPVLKAEDDVVSCVGIAIFSDFQYKETLSNDACFGFLFVKNKIDGGTIVVNDSEFGAIGVEILSANSRIWLSGDGDKVVLNCEIKTKLMLDEIEKGITASVDDKKVAEIEQLVNDKIEYMCTLAVNQCFEYESDPFKLGKYAQRDNSQFYKNYKDSWRKSLKSITPKITARSKLVRVNDNSVRS